MEQYRVALEELLGFAERLEAFGKHAEQIAESADNLAGHLNGNWSGGAAEAHQAEHEKWVAAAAEMRQAVAQLRTAARTAHSNYTEVVDINTAMWP